MRPRRSRRAVLVAAGTVLLVACGGAAAGPDPCAGETSQGFSLSLVRQTGGSATPGGAAARQSGRDGWRLVAQDGAGATLTRDRSLRHALRGPDGTWQVDAGHDC